MSYIMAGSGVVKLHYFILGSVIACFFSSLFVMTGRALLFPLNIFRSDRLSFFGYYYFMGLCPFFVTITLFSHMNISFLPNLLLSVIFLITISLIPYWRKKQLLVQDFFRDSFRSTSRIFLVGFLALFLLNIIARDRQGPIYAEVAQYILDTLSLPIINRHYGQSILAAIVLVFFKTSKIANDLSLAKMCVNLWLPISEVFLLLIVYNLTEGIFIKKTNRIIVCFIAFAGNCALSLLPYIPSDHDFPLICNVYTDSVIGLGLAVIAAKIGQILIQNTTLKKYHLALIAGLLYLLFAALNVTSELDMLVIAIALTPFFIFSIFTKRNSASIRNLFILFLAVSLALASCQFMGGIFMAKNNVHLLEHKYKVLFDDNGGHEAIGRITPTNPDWWYISYVLPGFYVDFGNYNSIFDGELVNNNSFNNRLLHIKNDNSIRNTVIQHEQINYLSTSTFVRAIYLAEMRLGTILKVLFWPLLALVGCIGLLRRTKQHENNISNEMDKNKSICLLTSNSGISFSIFSFLIGLSIMPLNSVSGNALYWRWALTRFNEIGLFLMMIYIGIFSTSLLNRVNNFWIRSFLALGLLGLFTAGVLIRTFIYPSLGGYR